MITNAITGICHSYYDEPTHFFDDEYIFEDSEKFRHRVEIYQGLFLDALLQRSKFYPRTLQYYSVRIFHH